MVKEFVLKHRDDEVAKLKIDLLDGAIRKVSVLNPELLPPGGNMSADELRKWWMRRAVPQLRGNIGNVLKEMGAVNTQSLLLQNLGIGLTDHYWLKPEESELDWKRVNLYENSFRDTVGELQFHSSGGLEIAGISSFVPGASLQGELKKKWIIGEDGKRYLVKGNYSIHAQQSINEVIATKIHKGQKKMPFASYQIFNIDTEEGEMTGCICENFTDIDKEFIPAYDVASSVKKKNDASEYESFISICSANGLDETYVRDFLEYQMLTDYLITNTDRHFNNFGVLRDTKTLKYIDMAPIFDSGNSMLWNRISQPAEELLFAMPVNSFRSSELDLLKYVKSPKGLDLSKLPSNDQIEALLRIDRMGNERVDMIMDWYHKKMDIIDQLQEGRTLKELAGKTYVRPKRNSR